MSARCWTNGARASKGWCADVQDHRPCITARAIRSGPFWADPPLQNIPLRTENGRALREAFAPKVFIKADYSALEMRIAASLANDEPTE